MMADTLQTAREEAWSYEEARAALCNLLAVSHEYGLGFLETAAQIRWLLYKRFPAQVVKARRLFQLELEAEAARLDAEIARIEAEL